ncbi:MAG TPA: hypothetical protein ENH09_04690 [Bacteroidetes bacterium]|nr:hypothetical protein [Bacteroidota bacterium]
MTKEAETIEIQKELFDEKKSKFAKYQELVIGEMGFFKLVKYELIMLLSNNVPGALGLFLRSKLYPKLLGKVGRNVTFGTNVVLRHPKKVLIGDNVVVDDNCVLDAKGQNNKGIFIDNGVFLGRNTILNCKNGNIYLGENANFGFNCHIFAAGDVKIGKNALVAAYTYFVGGDHTANRTDIPVLFQPRTAKGVTIGDNVWFGAGVRVLDGITIGRDAIIGSNAVVTKDIPDFAIAVGVPAKVIKNRINADTEKL